MGKQQKENVAAAVPPSPIGQPLGDLPEFQKPDRPAPVDGLAAALQRIEELEKNQQVLAEHLGRVTAKVQSMLFEDERQ